METNQQSLIDGWFRVFPNESKLPKPEKNVDILRSLRSKEELDGFKPEKIFSEMIEVIRKNNFSKRAFKLLIFKPGFKLTGYTFLGFVTWMKFEKGLELIDKYRGFLIEEVPYIKEKFTEKELKQMQEAFASTHHIPKYEGPLALAGEIRAHMSKSYYNLNYEYGQDINMKIAMETGIYDGLEFFQEIEYDGKQCILNCIFQHHKTVKDLKRSRIHKEYFLIQERRTKKTPEEYQKFIDYPNIYREKVQTNIEKIYEWAIPDFINRNGLEYNQKFKYNKWFDAVSPTNEPIKSNKEEYISSISDVFRESKYNAQKYNTKEFSKEELSTSAFGTYYKHKYEKLIRNNENAPKEYVVLPHELGLKNGEKKSFSMLDDFEEKGINCFTIDSFSTFDEKELDILRDIIKTHRLNEDSVDGINNGYNQNSIEKKIYTYFKDRMFNNIKRDLKVLQKHKKQASTQSTQSNMSTPSKPRNYSDIYGIDEKTIQENIRKIMSAQTEQEKPRGKIQVKDGIIFRVKYITRHYLHFSKLKLKNYK